jgi:hypothetical protein
VAETVQPVQPVQ